jgi:two-component system chemotaxis response regulator CheB
MKRKVLIVDDSSLMRRFHKQTLEQAGFTTELASNGQECLDCLKAFEPDVIVLDINMPVMDGLNCLKEIMSIRITPVVMVSSLTTKGAQASLDALALGAVDYIQKPNGSYSSNMGELAGIMIQKIVAAANIEAKSLANHVYQQRRLHQQQNNSSQQVATQRQTHQKPSQVHLPAAAFDVIIIGVSTGGPSCLQTILPSLPSSFPTPIVIAQHMPGRFTKVFSDRLDAMCNLKVIEVTNKQALQQGHIYLAQGDGDISLVKSTNGLQVQAIQTDESYHWHPSVSKLVESALSCVTPKRLCCIQLTGMGDDGANEMHKAYMQGATTIAESKETAVVFGMPGQLVIKKGATHVTPNHQIASLLMK